LADYYENDAEHDRLLRMWETDDDAGREKWLESKIRQLYAPRLERLRCEDGVDY
jgi:hypothetical protein